MMIHKIKLINNEFSEYIQKSVKDLRIRRDDYVEGYLVSLLSKFIKQETEILGQPLTQRLISSKTLEDYTKLGDEILFITGFFPETFQKKKKKKYAITIGKGSYGHAAVILNYEGEGYIYKALSKRFETYSDLINKVKYDMLETIDDETFMQIYKTVRDYNNQRASEKLKDKNIK